MWVTKGVSQESAGWFSRPIDRSVGRVLLFCLSIGSQATKNWKKQNEKRIYSEENVLV
jgi:hypothetical protein